MTVAKWSQPCQVLMEVMSPYRAAVLPLVCGEVPAYQARSLAGVSVGDRGGLSPAQALASETRGAHELGHALTAAPQPDASEVGNAIAIAIAKYTITCGGSLPSERLACLPH